MPAAAQPESVCILRLSALGDTCHVVPIVRTLQEAWPGTRFTWVIGKAEARLLSLLEGVEFITVDKRAGLHGSRRALRRVLGGRRFDVVLHMQLALRASLLAQVIRADVKLGFDRPRARELQWLFTNAQIAPRRNQHVLDGLFGFAEALGISVRSNRWQLTLPQEAQTYAARLIPDARPTLLISPCSSHALRNWSAERYASIADHAAARHGMRIILCGGPSELEQRMGGDIERLCKAALINQIGKDTLPQLLALMGRARALIAPDSGPIHMATLAGIPAIGLYAATRSARSGPYRSVAYCVDRYAQAARRFHNCEPEALPWTQKIERPGVMDLISVEAVAAKLDELLG